MIFSFTFLTYTIVCLSFLVLLHSILSLYNCLLCLHKQERTCLCDQIILSPSFSSSSPLPSPLHLSLCSLSYRSLSHLGLPHLLSPALSLTLCVSLLFPLYSLPFFSSLFFASKGCGIVEFSCPEEAQRAMIELNDTEFMGRQVFIREDREEGGGGGR